MKVGSFIKSAFFISITVIILTLVTPLAFTNVWLRNAVYLLTVVLSFVVARQLNSKLLKAAVAWLPLIVFLILIFGAFAFSFANRVSDDWRTSRITYREAKHKGTYIGEQILDVGALGYARRAVKVVPASPLFRWITKADTTNLGKGWVRVNEDYNPYNLKY
jgi:hypothetical protein